MFSTHFFLDYPVIIINRCLSIYLPSLGELVTPTPPSGVTAAPGEKFGIGDGWTRPRPTDWKKVQQLYSKTLGVIGLIYFILYVMKAHTWDQPIHHYTMWILSGFVVLAGQEITPNTWSYDHNLTTLTTTLTYSTQISENGFYRCGCKNRQNAVHWLLRLNNSLLLKKLCVNGMTGNSLWLYPLSDKLKTYARETRSLTSFPMFWLK